MKALVIFTIALALASCLSSQNTERIQNIKKNQWGKLVLDLAELHMESKGPIEDLVKAIEDLLEDLAAKQTNAEENFDQVTARHEEDVRSLQEQIEKAKLDIVNNEKLLEETLRPQAQYLVSEIARLEKLIEDTRQHMVDAKAERAQQKADFEEKQTQHNEVVAAIDEALELLNGLEGDSFAQIKTKLSTSLKKISNKLSKKDENAKWVDALLEIAEKDYADSDAVQKVVNLLQQIRNNTSESLQKESELEAKRQQNFEADMKNSAEVIKNSQDEIEESKANLEITRDAIAAAEQTIVNRQADQRRYEKALEDEIAAYEQAKQNFEELMAQFAAEQQACNDALSVIQNRDFADYIEGRVDRGGVIQEAHGEGLKVHEYSYDQ